MLLILRGRDKLMEVRQLLHGHPASKRVPGSQSRPQPHTPSHLLTITHFASVTYTRGLQRDTHVSSLPTAGGGAQEGTEGQGLCSGAHGGSRPCRRSNGKRRSETTRPCMFSCEIDREQTGQGRFPKGAP